MNNSVDECHTCSLAEWDQKYKMWGWKTLYISGNTFYETSIYDAL